MTIQRLTLALLLCAPWPLHAQGLTAEALATYLPPAPRGWVAAPAPTVTEMLNTQGDIGAAQSYTLGTERFLMIVIHGGPLVAAWAEGFGNAATPNPDSIRSEIRGHPTQQEPDMFTLLAGQTLVQIVGDGDIFRAQPVIDALDLDAIAALTSPE